MWHQSTTFSAARTFTFTRCLEERLRRFARTRELAFRSTKLETLITGAAQSPLGAYEELTDQYERDQAVRTLLTRFPQLTPVESVPVHDGQSSAINFRIRVREITGVG